MQTTQHESRGGRKKAWTHRPCLLWMTCLVCLACLAWHLLVSRPRLPCVCIASEECWSHGVLVAVSILPEPDELQSLAAWSQAWEMMLIIFFKQTVVPCAFPLSPYEISEYCIPSVYSQSLERSPIPKWSASLGQVGRGWAFRLGLSLVYSHTGSLSLKIGFIAMTHITGSA